MSLPPALNKTYERILERVNLSGSGVQRLVQATLQWIVNSESSLSIKAICEAISLVEGDTEIDKESVYDQEEILHCRSLIHRSADTASLEPAHFTVKDFLAQIEPGSPFSQYSQRTRSNSRGIFTNPGLGRSVSPIRLV
jgi:hypothetical protein